MADAFLSPAVGGGMWALAAAAGGVSIKKSKGLTEESSKLITLTGVSAAFVFAAQMINFTIPGTGSSGHIAGALFLTILLGPYLSFLAMGAILLIQALFFADGGILAYGANVINMAFFANFIAYPFIYKPLTVRDKSPKRIYLATIFSAVAALQLGAFAVTLQTALSGRVALPLGSFLTLMQSIHLAIGFVEGLMTAVLVSYLSRQVPEILGSSPAESGEPGNGYRVVGIIGLAALFCGGVFSLFASDLPDGLEWSIDRASLTLSTEAVMGKTHLFLEGLQEKLAFLPDYALVSGSGGAFGTMLSGFAGIGITAGVLSLCLFFGKSLARKRAMSK